MTLPRSRRFAPRNLKLFAPPEPLDTPAAPDVQRAQDGQSCARPACSPSEVPRSQDAGGPVRVPMAPELPIGLPPERVPAAGPSVDDLLERFAAEHRSASRVVPESQRERVRRGSLLAFWEEWIRPVRERAIAEDDVAKGTVDKERQVLAQFETWNLAQKPTFWPEGVAWTGLPLGKLSDAYLAKWVADQRTRCSVATVESRWMALRTVLNAAVAMRVLTERPSVSVKERQPRRRGTAVAGAIGTSDELALDDLCATQYTEEQLVGVYELLGKLAHAVEHQVAWVLGVNTGPRTEDLYGLMWHVNVRLDQSPPFLIYVAAKTRKKHWIPLAPVTVAQLRRLTVGRLFVEGPLFPSLSGHRCQDPGRSRAARKRTAEIKQALVEVGLTIAGDYEKPVQVLRSTCNSRYKNHRPLVGHLITHGPDYSDVNTAYYDDWRPRIVEAVMSLPQPGAFEC